MASEELVESIPLWIAAVNGTAASIAANTIAYPLDM
jgi:hypothetical protein